MLQDFSKEEVYEILKRAWTHAFPGSPREIRELKATDWNKLSSIIHNHYADPVYKGFNLGICTGEAFLKLLKRDGAGKKSRAIFDAGLYVLIMEGKISQEELGRFEDHKWFYTRRLIEGVQDIPVPQSLIPDNESPDTTTGEEITTNDLSGGESKNQSGKQVRIIISLVIIAAAILGGFLTFSAFNKPLKIVANDPRIKIKITAASNHRVAPTDITVAYDLRGIDYDSAFIDFRDGPRFKVIKERLSAPTRTITHSFTHPQDRSIIVQVDTVVKKFFVPIYSNGWFANLNAQQNGLVSYFLPLDVVKKNGVLNIPVESVSLENRGEFYTLFQNISDFGISADSIVFESRVKNPEGGGGGPCYDLMFSIIGENDFSKGVVEFNLLRSECSKYISIMAGDTYLEGSPKLFANRGSDLSGMQKLKMSSAYAKQKPVNPLDWVVVKAKTEKGTLYVFVDDKLVYRVPFQGEIGKLKFIRIGFRGSGLLDWVKLSNLQGKELYREDF